MISNSEKSPIGIGLDLVDLDRFETALERPGFKAKVFTRTEIDECESKPKPLQSYAARFAVKEALYKALADPMLKAVPWKQVETSVNEGTPQVHFSGAMKERMTGCKAYISLSHTEHTAAAVVLLLPQNIALPIEGSDQG